MRPDLVNTGWGVGGWGEVGGESREKGTKQNKTKTSVFENPG